MEVAEMVRAQLADRHHSAIREVAARLATGSEIRRDGLEEELVRKLDQMLLDIGPDKFEQVLELLQRPNSLELIELDSSSLTAVPREDLGQVLEIMGRGPLSALADADLTSARTVDAADSVEAPWLSPSTAPRSVLRSRDRKRGIGVTRAASSKRKRR